MAFSARLGAWVESSRVQRWIVALILINAVILGLQTSPEIESRFGGWLHGLDQVILAVFVAEIIAKLVAHRGGFFKNPWNVFDFFVVGVALFPASGPFAVLRVLRILRLISLLPQLRFVVEALLKAIPGIGSIGVLMTILFYVFAVIATGLFGEKFPEWFGSLGASLYTLFQVMTLESWSMGISRPVMEAYPYAWAFFVPFILLATFTILNLFIAIIVNTMQSMQEEKHKREQAEIEAAIHHENESLHETLKALRNEIADLRRTLERPN